MYFAVCSGAMLRCVCADDARTAVHRAIQHNKQEGQTIGPVIMCRALNEEGLHVFATRAVLAEMGETIVEGE